MSDINKGSGFFGGFILGGMLGIIAAFLLLPKDEKENWKARMMNLLEQGRKTFEEGIEEGKAAATQKEAQFRDDSVPGDD